MKKVLFIDRDGTLISEAEDEQIDSFEKLSFLPGAFQYLTKIVQEADFELVMITNQDGLGTESFPEDTFWPVHNFIMKAFENEGVIFDEVCIDKSFPHENLPTRKPGTGLLTKYLDSSKYDLANSFVLGDRLSDIELAKNLGAKGIFISGGVIQQSIEGNELMEHCALVTDHWKDIYKFLTQPDRSAVVKRTTNETDIDIKVDLEGSGKANISTGLAFYDHMLEQIAKHGGVDLDIKVKGDLEVDEHHTIEDTAIALGEAVAKALGDKKGIERYGFYLPMDDSLAQVAIDFGGRNWIVWEAEFKREKIGEMPTEMFFHFFKSFSDAAKCNLNIKAEGDNEHHKIEAIFKAFAKAIKMAVKKEEGNFQIPSTKGVL
ncbi:MAG: bifunctional histidinol-phosphatase/imidazoleglycerol-phosphate dehydratase HisB [Bacteroidota bacterium]